MSVISDAPAVAAAQPSAFAQRLYRAIWRWHFFAGLLAVPFMISLAVTGGLYLFNDEIDASLFRYRNYVDIFDGGPTLECDIDRVRAIRKSRLVEVSEGQPAPGDWPACLVSNENYANFRAMLVRTNPTCERLVLTAAQLDALKCNAGDKVRLVRLCPEEKTA